MNTIKKIALFFVLFLIQDILLAQTIITHEVVNSDTTQLSIANQVLDGNKINSNAEIVSENLDLVKTVIVKEVLDEGTNDPTTSGMILMYVDGKAVYTKVQKTGVTTLSIIYVPKQN